MATAEQYAEWIVSNQAKKGTPEFDTVAEAYKLAKTQPATDAAPKADPLAAAAPYYLGPAGTPRAVRDITHKFDELVQRGAYKAGGVATDIATYLGASPETAAKVGFANNVGIQAIPALLGGRAATAAAPALESAAKWLMQSSVKPGLAARESGDAARAINTMLEKGINATGGGLEAVQSRVSSLEDSIQNVLKMSPATVNKEKVASYIKSAADDALNTIKEPRNLQQVQKARNDFSNNLNSIRDVENIPVSVANNIKQRFYKELDERASAYEKGAALTSYDKGQKAIAGGLRAEIGEAVPAVVPSLKEQSELLNVLKVAGPQVRREGNKNPVGLGWLSPSMERTAAWMLDRYPWFKSMLARGLYSGSEAIPQAGASAGLAGLLGGHNDQPLTLPAGLLERQQDEPRRNLKNQTGMNGTRS